MYLNLDLFDYYLMIRFRLNISGKNPTLVMLDTSQHIVSEGTDARLLHCS